ncbi:PASTA domain-containing protein [Arachnia propionica]|uniref:PASTA domain-containing protein n=1 Tax=Arachnia propionica TaxID=1750 RepID=A0A3P1T1W4_9ACTN|nr:PASTA domain-containing protein [Arachnia propionica]
MFVVVSVLAGLLLSGLAVPGAALVGAATKLASDSVQYLPADLETPPQAERSRVLMADGSELATFYEDNRVYVGLSDIAQVMRDAQIAIEDHRFYEHGAIDVQGLGRAVFKNLMGSSQGASTLTQQYVKMVQIESAKARGDKAGVSEAQVPTIERKIREMRYAMAIEKKMTKDQILEGYLNIAYYGDGAYGVEAAARHYWGTSAAELTLDQAAMLAGIVQNPDAYNPAKNPEKAMQRRNHVLNRMAQLKVITKEEAEAASEVVFDPAGIQRTPNGCHSSQFPVLCDFVYQTLVKKVDSLGSTQEDRANTLKRGGLTIHTLIDPKAQAEAEAAVGKIVAPTDPVWGGTVLIQPSTGLIVAMAQSRPKLGDDPGETYYNVNVSRDLNGIEGFQAGSTFKPFVMAAALEMGMSPTETKFDTPSPLNVVGTRFTSCSGPFTWTNAGWQPKNYDKAHGVIDMFTATQRSVNSYYIQLEAKVGICNSIDMAQRLGVKLANGEDMRKESEFPSWVLGTSDVTPLSMAEAYATFANRGTHCDPIILRSIITKEGGELEVPSANCQEVVSPEVADGVNHVLKTVMTQGTGTRARIPGNYDQAGKTGTTNGAKAVFFAGYTPDMAGVAYVAVDTANPYWEGKRQSIDGLRTGTGVSLEGSGGRDAGSIWKSAMASALENIDSTDFAPISQKVLEGEKVDIPSVSGMSSDEAKAALEDAGFNVGRVESFSDRPAGEYLGRTTPQGKATIGSTVNLVYSKGSPPPEPTVVPQPDQPGQPGQPGQPIPIPIQPPSEDE